MLIVQLCAVRQSKFEEAEVWSLSDEAEVRGEA
jgi:hypothetical protein